jgi:hypothetical protein
MHKFIFIIFIASSIANAQPLYMPRNVQQAYKNGTRSMDGKPGKNYWQNFGRYNIAVTALPPDRTVKGAETIVYTNNSPDTIKDPVIRLVLNIHKPGAARYGNTSANYLTPGVVIDSFIENNTLKKWDNNAGTWQPFHLSKPLLPHDSVHLSFNWHYQISLQSGREGMIDSTTFYLAYFYPRVSVYDDYNGWDKLDFTDGQEFYNDFNNYNFSVTVPENYIVWATGTLLNPDEVLQPEYANKLKASMTTDSVIRIATIADLGSNSVTAQNAVNTWRWTANNITDVTVALSNHFNWDAASVLVDDATKRRASVQAAYNDTAADFHHMVEFGQHSLGWFSHNWPGVPYPFEKSTIVQGYADMEYPMMVNDASTKDLTFSRFVAEHEIAHTYFPFYMGINESRYAFMDEGWATTFEYLIGTADMGSEKAIGFYKAFRVNRWIKDASSEEDLPIITPANVLKGVAYGNNAYGKPSLGYLAVKDMLGDNLFKKCLHGYMQRWHGKHPIPWDFFNSFNDISGKDLNWFWSKWYFSNGYIDLAIQKVEKVKDGTNITIKNIGGFAAPVDVVVSFVDGTIETFHQTSEIWHDNQKQAIVKITTPQKVKSVKLNGGIFMDADESNNSWGM